jgi:hypothetical protein
MKTANIAGRINLASTFSLFSRLLLCIVFLHPLWCEGQQTGLRQKPKTTPRQFGQPTVGQPAAGQQGLNQTAAQTAPQQGATQTGTQSGATPVAGDISRTSAAPTSAQTQLPPAKTKCVFSDRMGGAVFSSGAEDIHVRILPNLEELHLHDGKIWTKATTWVHCGIYLVSPGPERFIGNNIPGDVTLNLGKIPAGEIIFAIKTYDGFTFQNGGGDRNPDNMIHAFTRTFALGPVEVWFEDSAGNGNRTDHDMDDVAIQLTGGVRGSGPWADLQKAVDEQAAGKRDAQNAPKTAKPQ